MGFLFSSAKKTDIKNEIKSHGQECPCHTWGVAGRIVWAWILTIPASAVVAAGTFLLIHSQTRQIAGQLSGMVFCGRR